MQLNPSGSSTLNLTVQFNLQQTANDVMTHIQLKHNHKHTFHKPAYHFPAPSLTKS